MAEKVTINVFSLSSIQNAKKRLMNRADKSGVKSVEELTRIGYEYMLSVVRMDSGALVSSVTWDYDPKNDVGHIRVGAKYALFVEYGTGVRGAASPHPEPIPGWVYDINHHGEAGWWYPTTESDPNPTKKQLEDGQWIAHTKGQAANAFVFRTKEFMKSHAGNGMNVRMVADG